MKTIISTGGKHEEPGKYSKIQIFYAAVLALLTIIALTLATKVYLSIPAETPTPAPTETPQVEESAVTPSKPEKTTGGYTNLAVIPEEIEAIPEPAYTDEELEMLAIVIYREAGADYISDTTRLMVGEVVLNRVEDDRYPDDMGAVLTQPYQYNTMAWEGVVWPARAKYESGAVDRAYECAKQVLEGFELLPDDVVFQSEYVQGEVVAYIDGLYFCR